MSNRVDVDELRAYAIAKRLPGEFRDDVVARLLDGAADEIERLHEQLENAKVLAGVVTSGPSFAQIKRDAKCAPNDAAAPNAAAAS